MKLVLVLNGNMEGPTKQLPAPYFSTTSKDQSGTTSTGDRTPIFSPERACAPAQTKTFPTMSSTALVESNSALSASTCARSRSFARWAAVRAFSGGVVPEGANRSASWACRHLPMWESYKTSRRSSAPRPLLRELRSVQLLWVRIARGRHTGLSAVRMIQMHVVHVGGWCS